MYTFSLITTETDYTDTVRGFRVPLPQTFWYGALQEKMGRRVVRIRINKDGTVFGCAQVIFYPMNAKLLFAYAPYGPIVSAYDSVLYEQLAAVVQTSCDNALAYVRLEIPYEHRTELPNGFCATGTSQVRGSFMQPRVDWELSLAGTDDALFEQFHKQTRKLVRKAQSLNTNIVIVDDALSDSFHIFESMMRETAARKGFSLHETKYYRAMMQMASARSDAFFAIAYDAEGKALAISFHAIVDGCCYALFGGSRTERRDAHTARLLKWESMRFAKQKGCTTFSFGGIAAEGDRRYRDWKGFSDFKRSFGGAYLYHGELVDKVYTPWSYHLYRIVRAGKWMVKNLF